MSKIKYFLLAIFILVVALFWIYKFSALEEKKKKVPYGQTVALTGIIESNIFKNERYQYADLFTGTYTVRIFFPFAEKISFGDHIETRGKVFYAPKIVGDDGRTFNYGRYLSMQGVYALAYVKDIKVLPSTAGTDLPSINGAKVFLFSKLFWLKSFFLETVAKSFSFPENSFVAGILLGEKKAIGKELEEAFRQTGLSHIVVLSGANISIIAQAVNQSLFFLSKRRRIFLSIILIILFGILVGMASTVTRAVFMTVIGLLAGLFNRRYIPFRALLITAVLMILPDPRILLYDASFQLSFLATFAVIIITPILENKIPRKMFFLNVPSFIHSTFCATLATQFCVTPLIIYLMGNISFIALFSNILIVPLMPMTMLISFVTVLINIFMGNLSFLGLAFADIISTMSSFLIRLELKSIVWMAGLPFSSTKIQAIPVWIVLLWYSVFFAGFALYQSKFAQAKFFKFWRKFSSILAQFIFSKKSAT